MKWITIILMCALACVIYGIVHDQITIRICLEYFTIGHPQVFSTTNPTLLGLGWGVIATWWVGVLLGVPLACAARYGHWPKLAPDWFIKPLFRLMLVSFSCAIIAGLLGWLAGGSGWVVLFGSIAKRVPIEKHVPFLVDLWAHRASYLSGFLGGIVLVVIVLLERQRRFLEQKFAAERTVGDMGREGPSPH